VARGQDRVDTRERVEAIELDVGLVWQALHRRLDRAILKVLREKDAIAPETDSLQLTPSARVLGEGAAEAPVDVHRVEKLRQAIADGSYRVDADRIAGKLIDIERTSRKD